MRAGPASRIDVVSASALESLYSGWLQAGFGSFAYRLAHLRIFRPALLGWLSVLFFFV
jgi:hypothetical protein